jgi:hypothetical protein
MKPSRYVAKCPACGVVTSGLSAGQDARRAKHDPQRSGAVYTHATGSLVLDCRLCGQPHYARQVRGSFSAAHECSAKCMASTGTTCECSCSGKNHGASHQAKVQP